MLISTWGLLTEADCSFLGSHMLQLSLLWFSIPIRCDWFSDAGNPAVPFSTAVILSSCLVCVTPYKHSRNSTLLRMVPPLNAMQCNAVWIAFEFIIQFLWPIHPGCVWVVWPFHGGRGNPLTLTLLPSFQLFSWWIDLRTNGMAMGISAECPSNNYTIRIIMWCLCCSVVWNQTALEPLKCNNAKVRFTIQFNAFSYQL